MNTEKKAPWAANHHDPAPTHQHDDLHDDHDPVRRDHGDGHRKKGQDDTDPHDHGHDEQGGDRHAAGRLGRPDRNAL